MKLKKIWYFIWKDDSLASWLVNVVLAIVLVKFIIYPGLGLLLSTSFPVVAVVSCSMEHGITNCGENRVPDVCGITNVEVKNFDDYWQFCGGWYESMDVLKETFQSFSFRNGFNKGDIMVLYGSGNINIGDVVVFDSGTNSAPIIHRVVGFNGENIMTKGDHNGGQLFFEKNIDNNRILGKAIFKIPYLGWVKVIFNDILGGVLK